MITPQSSFLQRRILRTGYSFSAFIRSPSLVLLVVLVVDVADNTVLAVVVVVVVFSNSSGSSNSVDGEGGLRRRFSSFYELFQ